LIDKRTNTESLDITLEIRKHEKRVEVPEIKFYGFDRSLEAGIMKKIGLFFHQSSIEKHYVGLPLRQRWA
jgi:hypothetical protein